MNGIKAENVHVYASVWIVYMLAAVLLVIHQGPVGYGLFYLGVCMGAVVLGWWVASLWIHATSTMKRSALVLGGFGIGMFLFSYAMVPMYHLVCHATSPTVSRILDDPVELNLVGRSYRELPVGIKISDQKIGLRPDQEHVVYVDMYNHADENFEIKVNVVMQPRSLGDRFEIVVPEDISLLPNQHTRFPLVVKYLGVSESMSQASMMLLLQDKKDEGMLGKTNAWQKMTRERGSE